MSVIRGDDETVVEVAVEEKNENVEQQNDSVHEIADPEAFSEFTESADNPTNATTDEIPADEKSNVTITDAAAVNFTKVNCLVDKTYGPVEVLISKN